MKVLYYITGAIAFVNKITSADLWSPVEKNVDLIEVGRDASPSGPPERPLDFQIIQPLECVWSKSSSCTELKSEFALQKE